MLLIPLTGKISRRNLPLVTISLILINCLVFFLFQYNDNQKYYKSEKFYFSSGLAEIELASFIEYRNSTSHNATIYDKNGRIDEEEAIRQYQAMIKDKTFLQKVRNEEIITPQHPEYSEWRELRNNYEHQRSKIISLKFGFIPSEARPITFITYMFLHGGLVHLLGNMLFLWLTGCMLEMGGGRLFCSATYLLTGLGAVSLFWIIYPQSQTPLVGASGAIAGFMGAFTVLYGKKRVKIFYWLGFYFNYLRTRAIYLLPLWLAKEFYSLFFGDVSNVAYIAHIGGLISGVLLGLINLKFLGTFDNDVLEPEPKDEISPIIEKALQYVSRLDMETGGKLLEQALAKKPDHLETMTHLFNVRKTDPQDARFHEIAIKLLERLTQAGSNHETTKRIFDEYTQLTSRPRLSANLYLKMIPILSSLGSLEKAECILKMFLKQKPDFPGIPTAMLKLAGGYRQKGFKKKYQHCLQLLGRSYPNSAEAQIARQSLAKRNPA
jgi:membrane associated rhomboid family serine protease